MIVTGTKLYCTVLDSDIFWAYAQLVGEQMTLADIAETAGIPARTIRFYIARGLLDGPVKGGRDAAYTEGHLARLKRIKRLQGEGRTLMEIGRLLTEPTSRPAVAPPTTWWQYAIAGDVVVWVRAGASPWRTKHVRRAVEDFARSLMEREETEDGKEPKTK